MRKLHSIRTALIALITGTTLIVFSISIYFSLSHFYGTMLTQIKGNLINQAEKEANKIYAPMLANASDAADLAALVGSMRTYDEALTLEFMKKIVIKNELFSGASLALDSGVVSPDSKYYLPYVYKGKDNKAYVDWSYNGPQYFAKPWYALGMSTDKRTDFSPIYQDNMNKMWISIVSPVMRDGRRIGVATTDLIIDSLRAYVSQLKVGETGYAYILTDDGAYLGKTAADAANAPTSLANETDREMRAIGETIIQAKQPGLLQFKKEQQLIAYAPVGETSLHVVMVYRENEILGVLYEALLMHGVVLFTAIVVFIAILIYIINRRIIRPLMKLSNLAHQVAGGNLAPFEVDYDHHDEIGLTFDNFQDMLSALRTAQEEIQSYTDSLSAKNAELERFTYTVSHDLRSPLITIKGFAGVVANEIAKGRYDRVQSDLGRIGSAADKMAELLDGLLSLSRIGRMANLSETVLMTELSQQVVELLHETISAKGIRVEVQPNMPEVFGDKNRMQEVIQNLLENAIKFINRPDGLIQIGCLIGPEDNVYFVRDNGPGIDPQYHTKIFDLFDKLDTHAEGSGIGLALVKRIVEYHGGKIWLESQLGEGATFFFTIKTVKS